MSAMIETPRSILAFRNGSIGNTLVAVPALRALHARFPRARLHVVVDTVGVELFRHCPWIDSLIVYDKRGADRSLRGRWRLIRRLRATRPTHAVLFKRFFRNGLLARLSGAPLRLGFVTQGSAPFLNLTIPYDDEISITRLNLRLVSRLGAAEDDVRPEIWLSAEDRRGAAAWLETAGLGGSPFVIGHYGGLSTPPDYLPRTAFARLLRRAAAPNCAAVLLAAGPREAGWAAEIRTQLPEAQIAEGLPVRTSAALIERARLFLGFNSGPAHLAAAVNTPGRIVFRPGTGAAREIAKWLPVYGSARPLLPPDSNDPAELLAWSEQVDYDPLVIDTDPHARREGGAA